MTSLRHLRSSTANKRPDPTAMVDGQLAMNYDIASPGLFFKDDNGTLIKVGPVHVGTTAPNVSPAAGGTAGNSVGEQWLDTTGGVYVLKVWDGSAWRSESGTFVDVSGDTMTGALTMANQQAVRFSETTANGSNYIALQATAALASNKTITLPDTTGTVVTTGDTGTVTSTMIENDTILNADVNASAAIAGTKVSPDFGSQTVATTGILSTGTGTAAAPSIAFTGDTNTGIYSPGADQVAVSTGGTGRLVVDATGRFVIGATTARSNFYNTTASAAFQLEGTGTNRRAAIIGDDAEGVLIVAAQKSGAVGGNQVLASSDPIGAVSFQGSDGSEFLEAATIFAFVDGTPGANDMPGRLVFSTTADGAATPTERMRITSAGNVGIGASSPAVTLDVANIHGINNSITRPFRIRNYGQLSATGYGVGMSFFYPNGTTSDFGFEAASIDSSYTAGGNFGNLIFSTNNNAGVTERMRIANDGLTSLFVTNNDGFQSRNSEAAGTSNAVFVGRFNATNTTNGTVGYVVWNNGNVQNTNNSYGAISDIKLKENIVDANSQWDDLKALQVRKYNFKEGQTHTQIGLVAQEAELVSPGLVSESPDRDDSGNDLGTVTKSVNYSVLYMKAVKALQEAMERIEQLETSNTDLLARVIALETA